MNDSIERIFTSSYWYHAVLSLIPIILIVIVIFAWSKYDKDRSAKRLIAAIASFTLLLGSAVGLYYWRWVRADSVECEERLQTKTLQDTKLYSLANGTKVEGQGSWSMFGGSFVISSADTYRYYYKEGDRIRQSSIPASSTYIEYLTDENIAPHLTENKSWKQLVCRYNGEERIWDYESVTSTIYYVLYIPEGSVVESFELN